MPPLSELVFEANRMAVCCSTYRNLLSPGAPGCVNRRDPRHIDLQMVIIIPDREQIGQLLARAAYPALHRSNSAAATGSRFVVGQAGRADQYQRFAMDGGKGIQSRTEIQKVHMAFL